MNGGEDDPSTEVWDFKDVLNTPVDGELEFEADGECLTSYARSSLRSTFSMAPGVLMMIPSGDLGDR